MLEFMGLFIAGIALIAVFSAPLWGPYFIESKWPHFAEKYGYTVIMLGMFVPWAFIGLLMIYLANQ